MIRDIHLGFAWFVVISNALAGVWVTAAHWLVPLRVKAMWWFLGLAELTIFVQVIIGVVMVAAQGFKVAQFHMFYGFVAIASVGIIYSYRSQLRHKIYLLYGLGSFFLMGLAIRAMIVGQPGRS